MVTFNSDEKKLIDYAKKKIMQYCKMRKSKGLYDLIYAFVLSDSGKIYDGVATESNQPQAGICAERHAINNMLLAETEKAKIVSIFVAGPVPKKSKEAITPCGICRIVIEEFSTPKTSIICSEFIRNENDWEMLSRIDRYSIKEIYPHPPIHPKWD
jgi:cytidine deaminase